MALFRVLGYFSRSATAAVVTLRAGMGIIGEQSGFSWERQSDVVAPVVAENVDRQLHPGETKKPKTQYWEVLC